MDAVEEILTVVKRGTKSKGCVGGQQPEWLGSDGQLGADYPCRTTESGQTPRRRMQARAGSKVKAGEARRSEGD